MGVALSISVDYTSRKSVTPRVIATQFGDGYVQEAADGINNAPAEWTLTVSNQTTAVISAIEATLVSAIGSYLDWTPPISGASAGKWRVPARWDRSFHSYNVESITFTLRQIF